MHQIIYIFIKRSNVFGFSVFKESKFLNEARFTEKQVSGNQSFGQIWIEAEEFQKPQLICLALVIGSLEAKYLINFSVAKLSKCKRKMLIKISILLKQIKGITRESCR